MAEKGQSPSTVVSDSIVIARDRDGEDGVSHAKRLVASGGPTERGKGTVSPVSGQPLFKPFGPQGPGGSNPIPPSVSSDVSIMHAIQLAQYYSNR